MPDQEFTFLGDALWLDFINTTRSRKPPATDRLTDADAYHRWATARKLRSDAYLLDLAEVHAFRDHLIMLADALATGRPAPARSIEAINRRLAGTDGRRQLVRVSGAWRLEFVTAHPPMALAAIAASAASTLSAHLLTVRCCAAEDCTLFFADGTPAQSRRFCSATLCGNGRVVERRRGLLR